MSYTPVWCKSPPIVGRLQVRNGVKGEGEGGMYDAPLFEALRAPK